MKISNERLIQIINILNKFEFKKESKFKFIATKRTKLLHDLLEPYNDSIFEINIDHCSVDTQGNVLKDSSGDFIFTPTKMKEREKKLRELKKKEIEFEPYFTPVTDSIFDEVGPFLLEVFKGIFFKEEEVDEILERKLNDKL